MSKLLTLACSFVTYIFFISSAYSMDCKLGEECSGSPGVIFNVFPSDGDTFICDFINAGKNPYQTITIQGWKDFYFRQESFESSPIVKFSIYIKGRFASPEDPTDLGQIVIIGDDPWGTIKAVCNPFHEKLNIK